MSCEFQLTATLEGIHKFLDLEKSDTGNEFDSSRKTLQNFKIALSPTGEIAAFAKSTWFLICESKWDSSISDGVKIKYTPSWHGHINCKPGEEITSIFCLPFFSQHQSNLGSADWTCIILGFSSGYIRFYTEVMQELACCILHEERITSIKCFSSSHAQQGKHQKEENTELYVLYKSVICILNKSHLFQTLHNKRFELAKGLQNKRNETENYISVDFKKYSFVGQEEITDACFLGQTLVSSFNTFDHLVTASLIGGFNSNFRASPPQTSLIISSGRRPFVGFHYTLEGVNSPMLTDVALAVASKIKNSVSATLPDWFSFGNKKSQSDKAKELSQEYAERLNCRFGLCDLWRQGQSIVVSPNGTFSAVTDSLGRVTLIDNTSGVAQYLWKGYRDAQCGFIEVQEDSRKLKKSTGNNAKPQARQALFIVIYAPKKGLIEIFTTQHGRRVITFKVTKNGHLLYTPTAQAVSSVSAGNFNLGQNQVIFISEEGFNEFSIPFHCALAEDNSKISRDLHVLKKMKMLLKMENNSKNLKFVEEIEKCAKELKTDDIRLQAIESIITYKNVTLEAFKAVLKVFLDALEGTERTEPAPKKIIAFAKVSYNLLQFYEFLISLSDVTPKTESKVKTTEQLNSLSEELRLPQNELEIILKVIQQISEIEGIERHTTKVMFEEKNSIKLVQYLSCFDFEAFLSVLDRNEKQETTKGNSANFLNFRSNDRESSLCYMGEVFYKGIFNSFSSFDVWKKHLESCCLNPKDLALSLICFWCNKNIVDDIFPEVQFLVEVLKVICSLNDPDIITVEYNTESAWWKQLRSFIAKNPHTLRGLFAALSCRSVTIFVEQEREFALKGASEKTLATKKNESSSTGDLSSITNDWETISKDSCHWDILIVQLQDVALLNAVLNLSIKTQGCLPKVPFVFEQQCLNSIQLNGTGRVSELVAKWLVQFGLEPSVLIDTNDIEFQTSGDGKEIEQGRFELIAAIDQANEIRHSKESVNPVLDYLALLKSRFPYSLTSSSLLGNMCWEYFAYWFKNISEIEYLKAAIQYLHLIPASAIKYGISCLKWSTYVEKMFETLAKMINGIGKVPKDKLCVQVIGLRADQVPVFLQLISEILNIMLQADFDEEQDFESNRETIWQNNSTPTTSSLVSVALSQPVIMSDLVLFHLQLCLSMYLISGLHVKQQRILSSLFDNVELSSYSQCASPQLSPHYQNLKLKSSRTEFLKKCLTAAVLTIELIEYIPPVSVKKEANDVPIVSLKVDNYKKWIQLCFELAGMWAVSLDDIRKHQVCELYSNGFDRVAEEVTHSVNDTTALASQLLVLGGKRLKYLIQDSNNLYKKLTKLSPNLNEWLDTLELKNFTYHGTTEDIEVLMRYTAKWLPEKSSDQKLAVDVIESLSFLKTKNT